MAGFQFIHIECYGRTAGKGKAGGRTVRSVVDEAERKPEACPHVESPKPPAVLFGVSPSEAADIAENRAGEAVDAVGRKMRADGLCLLAGVCSFPHTVEECKADRSKMEAYRAWEKDAVQYLKSTYGDALKSVVRHSDEQYPHLHFYAVPELGKDGRMSVDAIHHGRRAAAEVKAQGGVKGTQNKAYKEAMRQFQHDYFQAVGMKHGQARLGPGRRRMSREGWKAEQAMVEGMAVALENAKAAEVAKVRASAKAYRERVIEAARAEAAKIAAPARRFGGFIRDVIDGMTGRRAKLEREAEAKVEAVRSELVAKEQATWEKLKDARGELKSLRETNRALHHSVRETVRERDCARSEVAQLSKLVPQGTQKAALGTPAPRG